MRRVGRGCWGARLRRGERKLGETREECKLLLEQRDRRGLRRKVPRGSDAPGRYPAGEVRVDVPHQRGDVWREPRVQPRDHRRLRGRGLGTRALARLLGPRRLCSWPGAGTICDQLVGEREHGRADSDVRGGGRERREYGRECPGVRKEQRGQLWRGRQGDEGVKKPDRRLRVLHGEALDARAEREEHARDGSRERRAARGRALELGEHVAHAPQAERPQPLLNLPHPERSRSQAVLVRVVFVLFLLLGRGRVRKHLRGQRKDDVEEPRDELREPVRARTPRSRSRARRRVARACDGVGTAGTNRATTLRAILR